MEGTIGVGIANIQFEVDILELELDSREDK
jgi:hypothetical protein